MGASLNSAFAALGAIGALLFGSSIDAAELQRVRTGTAMAISPEIVVTSAHVIAGCTNPRFWAGPGDSRAAELVIVDERLDIALLRLELRTGAYAALTPGGLVRPGTDVTVIGVAADRHAPLQPSAVLGKSGAYRADGTRLVRIEVDAELFEGASGGPVIAPDGRVIGFIVGRLSEDPLRNIAVTSSEVLALASRLDGVMLEHPRKANRTVSKMLSDHVVGTIQCE